MRDSKEPVQVKCPKCKRTQIVYIPEEEIPDCPNCKVQMNIEELLDKSKSYCELPICGEDGIGLWAGIDKHFFTSGGEL